MTSASKMVRVSPMRRERVYSVGEIRLPRQRAAQVAKYWGLHVNVYLTAKHKWPAESWFWNDQAWERVI